MLYSFHPGGVYVSMCDRSVRFVNENIQREAMFKLLSRDDGFTIDPSEF